MNRKVVLSGIKPTGKLTLGNYIGALRNFKSFQEDNECYIFIADLHALTLPIEPSELNENTKHIASFYLASGLDINKTHIFLQSSVSEHSELNSIMMNYLYMGELSRMTQFKEKSKDLNNNSIGLGIFSYPVLMACDIILYDTNEIPVGEDQVQHCELTRDLVRRFNNRYGKILVEPKAIVSNDETKKIYSLATPDKKMSKSDPKGCILLTDDEKAIRKKIMSAVTDLGNEIKYDKENKPGISNLMVIYSALTNKTLQEVEDEFKDCHQYGTFKKAVADAVVNEIIPLQEKAKQIENSNLINEALRKGRDEAKLIAHKTLKRVQEAVGLYDIDK